MEKAYPTENEGIKHRKDLITLCKNLFIKLNLPSSAYLSDETVQQNGSAHGSVITPTLFTLATNDIATKASKGY